MSKPETTPRSTKRKQNNTPQAKDKAAPDNQAAPESPSTTLASTGPQAETNTDSPWGIKDTFKWLVSLLRSHNRLLDSHVRLQDQVQQIRRDMLELARLPITHAIWTDAGTEQIMAPQPPQPVPMPVPTASLFEPEESEAEESQPDKTPLETPTPHGGDRQAQEVANIGKTLTLSKPIPPSLQGKVPKASKLPATGSTSSGTSKKSPPHKSSAPKHPAPHPPRSNKTLKTSKTSTATPVKAKPPIVPPIKQALQSHKPDKTDTAATPTPTPAPKRRRSKSSPPEVEPEQIQDVQAEAVEPNEDIFASEEEHEQIESEQSVEPPEAPKKKKKKTT